MRLGVGGEVKLGPYGYARDRQVADLQDRPTKGDPRPVA